MQAAASIALALFLSACAVLVPVEEPAKAASQDVTLCHKGKKTMTLPREAADAHIGHGDRYGRC